MQDIDLTKIVAPDSEYISSEDLKHGERIIEIIGWKEIIEDKKPKVVFTVKGWDKKFKPCKSMGKMIEHPDKCNWGSKVTKEWQGRLLELFAGEALFKGEVVKGVRICGASDIEKSFETTMLIGRTKYTYKVRKLERAKSAEEKPTTKPEPTPAEKLQAASAAAEKIRLSLLDCTTIEELDAKLTENTKMIDRLKVNYSGLVDDIQYVYNEEKTRIETPHDVETGEVTEVAASGEIELF